MKKEKVLNDSNKFEFSFINEKFDDLINNEFKTKIVRKPYIDTKLEKKISIEQKEDKRQVVEIKNVTKLNQINDSAIKKDKNSMVFKEFVSETEKSTLSTNKHSKTHQEVIVKNSVNDSIDNKQNFKSNYLKSNTTTKSNLIINNNYKELEVKISKNEPKICDDYLKMITTIKE